ncbi:MAG TPA: DUF433 domain-containing protein [Pyrinomonadaceae bacterium]|nr:DUF433 domain-containing protein [Pyrinomonadaceae bacterium]
MVASKEYVKWQDEAYKVVGTRISIDSIVYAFRAGVSPESIQRSFPTLTLEQVYGVIAFYLGNTADVDKYLIEGDQASDALDQSSRDAYPEWYEKLERARKEMLTSQS